MLLPVLRTCEAWHFWFEFLSGLLAIGCRDKRRTLAQAAQMSADVATVFM